MMTHLPSWLWPLLFTGIALLFAYSQQPPERPIRHPVDLLGSSFDAVGSVFLYGAAVIVSLIAWLVWALVR